MTLHYHGTPITPGSVLQTLAGRHFCVSFAAPAQVETCHRIGQSVMLDNGAFSFWTQGVAMGPGWWDAYYGWCERWLRYPTTWAVIPDVIDGTEEENDRLLVSWPHGTQKGAPVWHMHESLDRLQMLVLGYRRVCIGSSGAYRVVGSEAWHRRMCEAFNRIYRNCPAELHMLRGMSLVGGPYPFASVDSTAVARNHAGNNTRSTPAKDPVEMAARLDAVQCPPVWEPREQLEMEAA